jgi:hypothetical protein
MRMYTQLDPGIENRFEVPCHTVHYPSVRDMECQGCRANVVCIRHGQSCRGISTHFLMIQNRQTSAVDHDIGPRMHKLPAWLHLTTASSADASPVATQEIYGL